MMMLQEVAAPPISAGDTAWVLTSSALVLLMIPGLALFYGGLVRSRAILNTFMMSFAALAVVGVQWVLFGYALAFEPGLFENRLSWLGLSGVGAAAGPYSATIPHVAFSVFQVMFAGITVALISGAMVERIRFRVYLAFAVLWTTLVYDPIAHFVWGADGFLHTLGALDFAGGTAVHINAGAAGLALCLVLGVRKGFGKEAMRPHNLPLVMIGTGMLWFGWFGFNAGSALVSNGLAGIAFINTQVATAAALLGWLLVERLRDGHFTTLGAASGAVAGLVAITPACGTVSPAGAIVVGGLAGMICAVAIGLKNKFGFDDALDVVGVHLVGGLFGTLSIGFMATQTTNGIGVDGLFYGGDASQLGKQAVAALAVMGYSFTVTLLIALALKYTMGIRVSEEAELTGIDQSEHAETAYEWGGLLTGSSSGPPSYIGAAQKVVT